MMFLSIECSEDIEEGLLTYDRFGYVFTVSLVACIAINFLRIICAVCVAAKHKYTRKLHKFSANASLYDKAMNAGKGHR